ncbi:MAG: hypothetical protein A2878_02960 [Candidatus Moranbacteria bacterium RIFCSPHIGHO2_01_FULL_54_31]|nr:MAG: hypothetical protein A2878_02960 [Candidatus Moranbacteria bacterium RIFCSPHIGHO2_01_FULL_54_31]
MIPVHIKRNGAAAPDATVSYIVAENGLYLQIKNDWVDAVVPVDLSTLEKEEERARLLLPLIDAEVFAKVYAFFYRIYQLYHSESAVLLHFGAEHGWAITIPVQEVSAGGVHYDMTERIAGYRCVGTMHSHGSLAAMHSTIDDADEAEFDGVHIILGDLNRAPRFSMEASLVVRSCRFPLDDHIVGITPAEKAPLYHLPPQLMAQLRFGSPRFFTADLSVLNGWEVPDEWIAKVTNIGRIRSIVPAIPTDKSGVNQ